MATRTSQPAGGALLISELKEFASFPKATQRYIRRSLDVAYGRSDPLETWARDEIEAAAIAAQSRFYKQLDHLRQQSIVHWFAREDARNAAALDHLEDGIGN